MPNNEEGQWRAYANAPRRRELTHDTDPGETRYRCRFWIPAGGKSQNHMPEMLSRENEENRSLPKR